MGSTSTISPDLGGLAHSLSTPEGTASEDANEATFPATRTVVGQYLRQLVADHPEISIPDFSDESVSIADSLSTLSPEASRLLGERLGARNLRSLTLLARESNPRLFLQGLLHLSHRWQEDRHGEAAMLALSAVRDLAGDRFAELRRQAEGQLAILNGGGSVADRFENFGRELLHETFNPVSIGSMAGAQLISSVSCLRFMRFFRDTRLASPLMARTLSHTGAFVLEAVGFVGLRHGLSGVFGHPPTPGQSLSDEILSSFISLGALRVTGMGARALLGRTPTGASLATRLGNRILPEVAMIGGVFLGSLVEMHYGLRPPQDIALTMADALAMYVQFRASGAAMNRIFGPRYEAMNRQLHAATAHMESSLAFNFGNLFGPRPALAMAGVPHGIEPSLSPEGATILMMEGAAPGSSVPPPSAGSGLDSLPPGNGEAAGRSSPPPASPRGKPHWAIRAVEWLNGRDINWNRFSNPDGPLPAIRTAETPAAVDSIENGMLRTIAATNPARRQVWYARRIMDLTRDLPETRAAFVRAEEARMEFHRGMRARLDPLLKNLTTPDYEPLARQTEAYERGVHEILGAKAEPFEADALLNATFARRLTETRAGRAQLTAVELRSMGYDPNAIHYISQHPDAFLPGALEALFERNSELAAAPGASELREAYRHLDPDNPSPKSAVRMGKAFTSFLTDPGTQALWLSEVALHASAREMLRRNPQGFTTSVLDAVEGNDIPHHEIPAFAERVNRFKVSLQRLQDARTAGRSRGLLDRLARLAGRRDYAPLHQAMADHEAALVDLLTHHENQLLPRTISVLEHRADALPSTNRFRLETLRRTLMETHFTTADSIRETLLGQHDPIRDFFDFYDREVEALRETGSRVGWTHANEMFNRMIRPRLDPARYQVEVQERLDEISERFERHLADYHKKAPEARDGRFNPRDFNRSIEAQLEDVVKDTYGLLERVARSHNIELGEWRRILPMFETYAHKADLPRELTTTERYGNILRFGIPAISSILQFNSGLTRQYAFEYFSRIFMGFGSGVNKLANPQTFYTDPNLAGVLSYFHYAHSGDHNTHLDFIGHADNIRQAVLGARARPHDVPDILAKIDLSIPLIEKTFPYITNMIPNDLSGVRRAEIRAAHMQSFGSLPHRRLRPTMPLGYDNLTMDVTNGESPYSRDPHATTTGSLQVRGRPFAISEMATAITGRPQGILFVQDPGAIRNYPSQRGKPAMLNNPSSMVSQFFPLSALPEPIRGVRVPFRNNVERLIWFLQGFHPDVDPGAPATDAIYARYHHPLDPATESAVASLYRGAWDVYPTREGIERLETRRADTRSARDLELMDRVLAVQTRNLLRNEMTVMDQRLAVELATFPDSPEAAGLRRLQRILAARTRTLASVERKAESGDPLTLTERKFLERAGTALAGRGNVSGTDHILEQLNYYFAMRDIGVSLPRRLLEAQDNYYRFVERWNDARKDPTRPEYHQLHVSEHPDYAEAWNDYRIAMETVFNLHGYTPSRWEGEIFPDLVIRREGSDVIIEPRDFIPNRPELSRSRLWRFLLDDSLFGVVPLAIVAEKFDPTPNLYLTLHRAWGHRAISRVNTRVRLQNTERLREVANQPIIVAPTHDSAQEFPTMPSVLHDYGIQAFFMADRKFFDPFWGRREVTLFGRTFSIPVPQPPVFGTIRGLLGPMDQYGHFSIDRGDGRAALQAMKDAGAWINRTGRSLIIFPAGTRNEVQHTEAGERYEGTMYGVKPGAALSWEGSRGYLLPIGLRNGGIIFPKQAGEAFVSGGAMSGMEYFFNFGEPLHYSTIVPDKPHPTGSMVRGALVPELNRQYHELTGREVGPPAESKAKKNRPARE